MINRFILETRNYGTFSIVFPSFKWNCILTAPGPPVLNLIYWVGWQYKNIRETLLCPRSWSEQRISNCLKQMPSIIGHWDFSSCVLFFSFSLSSFFCHSSLVKTNPPFLSLHSHCAKIPMATDMCNSLSLPPSPSTSKWPLSQWAREQARCLSHRDLRR